MSEKSESNGRGGNEGVKEEDEGSSEGGRRKRTPHSGGTLNANNHKMSLYLLLLLL